MQNNPATYFYVTNKHSVPTQICLDPNAQNQSRHHDNHFNIRTNQKNLEENHAKAGKFWANVSALQTSFSNINQPIIIQSFYLVTWHLWILTSRWSDKPSKNLSKLSKQSYNKKKERFSTANEHEEFQQPCANNKALTRRKIQIPSSH